MENSDGVVEDLFKANPQLAQTDARDWAKHNPRTFQAGGTLEAMLASLSDAGAQHINILPKAGWAWDFLVIVTLPRDTALREKLFASDSRLRQLCGMERTEDFGQQYLAYPFRNTMFKAFTN